MKPLWSLGRIYRSTRRIKDFGTGIRTVYEALIGSGKNI
jgi:hypothetical protein